MTTQTSDITATLMQRFFRTFEGVQLEKVSEVWQFMQTQYGQSHRYYHTLAHIDDMYDELIASDWQLRIEEEDMFLLKCACYFHDIVYDTSETDNEIQSSGYAYEILTYLGYPSWIAGKISDLICVTAHVNPPRSLIEKVLVDADFGIFSDEEGKYLRYAKNVRLEYSQYSDEEWITGRSEFLGRLLERNDFYYVDTNQALDNKAWGNVHRELKSLERLKNGTLTWNSWPYGFNI